MKSPYVLAVLVSVWGACAPSSTEPLPSPTGSADGSAFPPGSDATAPQDGVAPSQDASLPVDTTPEQLLADKSADCTGSYQTTAPKSGANTGFMVAGQSRSFELILPPASFTGPRPLFMGFNGTSENGLKFSNRARLADFAARGFVVLAPSSVGNGYVWPIWDGMRTAAVESAENKDLALFDSLLKCTAAHFSIDKKRIYVGGHSAGGIFTNRVLRARSSVIAGGIVGSGVWSLTGAATAPPLDGVFALVTWGGDNDRYTGTTPSGVHVPSFSFVEQASLASKFYEGQPAVGQAYCRGNNLGHAWLPLNDWFVDVLLAHPKGLARVPGLPPVPAAAASAVQCSEESYSLDALPDVPCKASTKAGCQSACQLMADCAVENRTVGTVLQSQLQTIGFTPSSCGGCVDTCAASSDSAANTAALSCFQVEQAAATCGPGIEGAFPLFTAVNKCCDGRSNSTFCVGLCRTLLENDAASAFFPVCDAIVP